ncbi:septum formation protein Maf [Campylobacter iguaniorum]|uniref:Nucleoside triphosphate pyrophosphatase n=1 Tax=Campylobacter iguaniorum TaxID=1244531 RepID=A0A076F9C4_9BACT|nr:septum formation inhibitor Maf [Campylobacter iguaniorum]AII14596.1 septum formation protein Maf [Campylobacter iguaniorum]ANE35757.1 septum formation protein Maf [Campylobacter iguaniorum]
MIILASSSPTRAKILSNFGVEFRQISMQYDENLPKCEPKSYAMNIVNEKSKQFFAKFKGEFDRVLFADSSVIAGGQILGKAKDINEARNILNLQSGSVASIYTAMKFISTKFKIDMLSVATYRFAKFDEKELEDYLQSGLWQGKAGAMMIEGFNKQYILQSHGNTSTAMGLDIENLKAFL